MMSKIQCDTHQLLYIIHLVNKFQIVITHECKVIHIQIPKSNQICSFLTILDSISWLTLPYIHDGPNSILSTSATIYYPTCQQISDCYNARVPSYSHTNSGKQSNLFIFDHFGQYFLMQFHFLFMMGQIQYCTHQLQYIIQLVNKFQIVITHECKVIHKQIPKSNQICSFLKLLDSISWLISLFIHDGPNSILYTSTTIYYPSCQQILGCYIGCV